ncbi:2-hydroxyacid dehydrogenase [Nocardioides pocheonensis]|uniref:Dihydrofolate reductase n=1 Tax=Nocardioides pocheonensis TaxID=661485 RepID=A0A3N0GQL4_9ACTN|nr:2-hydroxyacid dehydrogenase [Nocardioides pocheonensis]RNM14400.1 dihydrofolate reductase [Nocardioides pocheonensis]
MTEPLVWLPFSPEHLVEPPAGLRYEVVRPEPGEPLPPSAAEVEVYVPAYQMGPVDPDLFTHLPRLKVVQTLTAGVDHIRGAVPDGVVLCNGRGIHDTSTAELALTLVLASLRGIPAFVRAQDRSRWEPERRESLADKRVLIVGHGQIGAAIEARILPFEAEVVRVARRARPGVHAIAELPSLLPDADVVVLIVPGTAETRHLVDEDFLGRMKSGALLVNMARGSVVDHDALATALHDGRISAALDVTEPEPLPPDHPLWSAPNLLLTPHVGGASSAMWPRAYRVVREQLERYARGETLANQVTGEY